MIINENLLIENNFSIKSNNGKFNNRSIKFNVLNLLEGKVYTLTCLCKQTSNGSGNYSIAIFRETVSDLNIAKTFQCGKLSEFTFKYDSKNMDRLNFYPDVNGRTSGVGAEFSYVKLEPGDTATPYIPHENTIETAKRQYFIGGVRSKRYSQSLKVPRQSSFRKGVAA